MNWIRKSLIFIHRYVGIALSLIFVVWFVSGLGMMWAKEMPSLTPQLRLARLAPIDSSQLKLSAAEAAAKGDLPGAPGRVLLLTVLDRPAYRFGGGGAITVFADNGEVMPEVDETAAIRIASRFMNVAPEKIHSALLTEADQWTVAQPRQLPLHKISVEDPDHTQLYVSPQTGEVVLLTTRGSRALAWVAAIPHWLYFTSLRANPALWRNVVLWVSGVGCFLALIGVILGIIQFRYSRPIRFPYSGWMQWHYITGIVFGIFTFTWVFSGWLSMEPSFWASGGGLGGEIVGTLTGGPLDAETFPAINSDSWNQLTGGGDVKEIEFSRMQGEPYYIIRKAPSSPDDKGRVVVAANTSQIKHEPFTAESILGRVREAYPDVPIAESQLLADYDSYYYSQDRAAPLPVLRVKLDDPDKMWFYIDPEMNRVVAGFTKLARIQRWIYHGLHSLDFSFWYYSSAWWVGLAVLLLGGTAVSALGLYLGIQRLWRGMKRTVRPAKPLRDLS